MGKQNEIQKDINLISEVYQILIRDSLNNYNMSSFTKEKDLYNQMRNDIKSLCKYIKKVRGINEI